MSINKINNYYEKNKKYYSTLQTNIKNNINGRICRSFHAMCCLDIIHQLNNDINYYLEIGVHNGASMSHIVSSNKKIICYGIDLFENTFGHYLNDNITMGNTLQNIKKNSNNKNNEIHLIKGNSFHSSTELELNSLLKNQIDLLFIDADHSYNGVKNDFDKYSKYINLSLTFI